MTPREKILRDALDIAINEIQSFDCDINDEGIIFNCTQRLLDALKEADAIKDGPSEEDKKYIKSLDNLLFSYKGNPWHDLLCAQAKEDDAVCTCNLDIARTLLSKLKHYMEIE